MRACRRFVVSRRQTRFGPRKDQALAFLISMPAIRATNARRAMRGEKT
jgi:hypothetical protein